MSSQIDRSRRARRAGLVLTACLVVAGLWFLLPRALAPGEVDLVRAQGPRQPVIPALVLADAPRIDEPSLPPEARTSVASALVEDVATKPHATRQEPPAGAGRIIVRAVDALTHERLDRLRVRAMSSTRLADRDSGARRFEVELVLTPDSYAGLVLVPGYEPADLAPVRVAAGERLELRTVELRPGSARILGTVGRALQPGETLLIELMGKGRRPCDDCAPRFGLTGTGTTGDHGAGHGVDVCEHCGFGSECSRRPVWPSGDFAFDGLASGTYALRLDDGRAHDVGEQLSVNLREAESARIEMDAPLPRTLRVELIDTDGASLAGTWGANVRHRRAVADARDQSAQAERPVGQLDWRFELHANSADVRTGTFSTPTAPGTTSVRPAPFGGRKLGAAGRRTVDDKPLRDGQALGPEADQPRFAASPIAARVDEEGLVVFEGVPACELKLVLTCGTFRSTVDLGASSETSRATARLEEAASEDTASTTFRAFESARYR